MKTLLAIGACLFLASGAVAQEVASAPGAVLRWLDKVSGVTTEVDVATGQTVPMGRLKVTLGDCRYPVDDPSSNAFAHLAITDTATGGAAFDGWMIASSPALSALDDPRYDVWLVRCSIS